MSPAKGTKAEEPVKLPTAIAWQQTTIVRKGGFVATPIPEWALTSVKKSYDDTMANADAPALTHKFDDEKQAKAVLHQLRRAAKQLDVGLSAKIEGAVLTFQARTRKVVAKKDAAA